MGPLLTAKLTVPPVRAALVDRPRLTARLNAGLAGRLILVAAPPGAGKSTLLSSWLRGASRPDMPAAWLSLDEGDNDPARFFLYLIAALEQVLPGAGDGARALLGAPRPVPPAALMAALLSGLERPQRPFLLVLDDFHALAAPGLIAAVALLVEHLPPGAHLVIGSRSEPSLPLARLRVRGELTELGGEELRFTPAEAAAFLTGGMGLQLPDALLEALEARTEGWIAGLQLAALSLRGRPDPAAAVAAFSGSHRFVLDYLASEVLERQRPEVREFLLATAVLDRLIGPLCDALTGRADGQAMLAELERANLLLLPLDDERRWYRYHHLFADFLRARLEPGQANALHRAAAGWCAANGMTADAVGHAFAAGDAEWAAALLEPVARALVRTGETATLMGWLDRLPPAATAGRPLLAIARGWCLLTAGRFGEAEAAMARFETPADLRGEVTAIRAIVASVGLMNPAATVALAAEALAHLPPDDRFLRCVVGISLGTAHVLAGEAAAAGDVLARAVADADGAGHLFLRTMARATLAQVREWQGRLDEAAELYHAVTALCGPPETAPVGAIAYADVGLGGVLQARGDLPGAVAVLERGKERAARWDGPELLLGAYESLIKAALSQRAYDRAAALLAEGRQLALSHGMGQGASPLEALGARLDLARGNVAAAERWAAEVQAAWTAGRPRLLQEQEELVVARILLARRRPAEALTLLEATARRAEAGGRLGSLPEALMLEALARGALGDRPGALATLSRAEALAATTGHVQLFRDDAEALAALTQPGESLTGRELEVLRLAADGLSNAEIAARLVLTEGTVKVHLNRIYGKLAVPNRTSAAARARELGLLNP